MVNGDTSGQELSTQASVTDDGVVSSSGYLTATTHTLTPSGAVDQFGYALNYVTGTLSVNKANLTLSGAQTYNGTTTMAGSALTATGVNGETFTVTGTGASDLSTANVQTNQLLANVTNLALGTSSNGGLSGNYNALSTVGSSVTVNKANLTVTANDALKVGDGIAYSGGNGVVYAGFVNNETNAVLVGILNYTGSSQGATNDGIYTITPIGLTSGNYQINFVNGTLTITPSTVTPPPPPQPPLPVLPPPSAPLADGGSNTGVAGFSPDGGSTSSGGGSGNNSGSTSSGNSSASSSNNSSTSSNSSSSGSSGNSGGSSSTPQVTGGADSASGGEGNGATGTVSGPGSGGISISLVRQPSLQETGIITVSVPKEMATLGSGFSFPLPAQVTQTGAGNNNAVISVSTINGQPLPSWLKFNPETKSFIASAVPDGALPMQVRVTVDGRSTTIVISERNQ